MFALAEQHRAVTAFIIALLLGTMLAMCFKAVEGFLSDEMAKHFHLWFQFICGDWPSFEEGMLPRKSWGFSIVLTCQFLLAVGPILGVLGLFWYLARFERRQVMTLMDALRIRDRMIKTQLLGKVPPEDRQNLEQDFNDAFNQASKRWVEQQLPTLIGSERAKWVLDRIEKDQI